MERLQSEFPNVDVSAIERVMRITRKCPKSSRQMLQTMSPSQIERTDADLRVQCPGWSMHWSRSHKHWFYDPGPKAPVKVQYWKTDECPVGWAFQKGKGYFHILDPKHAKSTAPSSSSSSSSSSLSSKKRPIDNISSNITTTTTVKRSRFEDVVVSLNACVSKTGALHVPSSAKIPNLHGEILKFIRNGIIKFPFKSLYFESQKHKMFGNLQRLARDLDSKTYFRNERFAPFRVQFRQSGDMFPFTFSSSSSTTSRYYLHIENESEYWDMQILTDLYSEERRLSARRNYQRRSVLESFRSDEKFQSNIVREALVYRPTKRMERMYADISTQALMSSSSSSSKTFSENTRISSFSLRECVYKCMPECTQFKLSLAVGVLRALNAKRVLDISAGWGDRLLANLACGVERYVATDPNTSLRPTHDRIIADFCSKGTKATVLYEPFETANLPEGEMFDTVFTSPPFFDFEIYVPRGHDDEKRQSISKSKGNFESWMAGWLFPALKKAWSRLLPGGHIAIHITDVSKCVVCEPMCLFMQSHLPGSIYAGCIGSIGEARKARPIWVFRKAMPSVQESQDTVRRRNVAHKILHDRYYNAMRYYR